MKIVEKPWGREEWLELNDSYCFKRLLINAGQRTSLQYHHHKLETIYVVEGTAEVLLDDEWKTVVAGDYFTVTPPTVHRMVAKTDLILHEVSTPQVDDVVRLADDHARPDGRIDTEHDNA